MVTDKLVTMQNFFKRTMIVSIPLLATVFLAGCAGESKPGQEIYQNSETVQGLIYRADGTTGDGADDVKVTITPTSTDQTGEPGTDSLVPWTKTTSGAEGDKVKMTVESLSTNGEAECQISYQDIIIHNTASGDHAVAVCEGTLSTWAEQNR